MFTFASDIRVVRAGMMRVWAGQFACRWLLALRWSLAGLVCLAGRMPGLRGLPVTVFSAAAWLASVLRRRWRVFGGRPAAARRVSWSWRVSNAVRMRWLRTASRQAANSAIGVSPMSRHQPRLMSLLAGSLTVEKVRSAAERRA